MVHEVLHELSTSLLGHSKVLCDFRCGRVAVADARERKAVSWPHVTEPATCHPLLDPLDKLCCQTQHCDRCRPIVAAHRTILTGGRQAACLSRQVACLKEYELTVLHPADATPFETHGSRFSAYVAPSRGSQQLCAWRLEVPAGLQGVAHRPSREEVLLILDGDLRVTLDHATFEVTAGDVIVVPADSELLVDGGSSAASAWVTTTPGLEAVTADGTRIVPPWAQ
jgi:quercetin dioxygenase-like cupin family protein